MSHSTQGSRARVRALVLVNWKGVFYERYLLDRHVTALEGANGAGKTTVMIAAYVVLLPDMSRLRFTNLGESGATGGDRGIWGRLGEQGRPSYTALELELADGSRLIAGVKLQRGGEPSVEPTPFLIEQLPQDAALSELLLVRHADTDQVPELDEIKAQVKHKGGKLEVFRSVKDYFAALFERGVTPLRLATDEDRNKLNEMLRTSMTGGISRVLTSELRSFLLKEESGLGDTLGRMRANLDACRRTRLEVSESRVLEREISGVYEAGLSMFSAAMHASRAAAEEAQRRQVAAEDAAAEAARVAAELASAVAELAAGESTAEERLTQARRDHEEALGNWERAKAAAGLTAKLAVLDEELAVLSHRAEGTKAAQAASSADRTARRQEREAAQAAYERAALGLAHLQEGLDELHRRAHAYRQLHQHLAEARALLLGREGLTVEEVPTALATVLARRQEQEAQRAKMARRASAVELQRKDFERAAAALAVLEAAARLTPPPARAPGGEMHQRARAALGHLAQRDAEVAGLSALERELADATRLAERQRAVLSKATALGVVPGPGAAVALDQRVDTSERELRALDEEAHACDAQVASLRARLLELRGQRDALEAGTARWQAVAAAAARAVEGLAPLVEAGERARFGALGTPAELSAARELVAQRLLAVAAQRDKLVAEREAELRTATSLDGPGAALDPELLRLRDEVGGELLLGRFDDVEDSEAATLEARLGPLEHALVVEDPEAAAQQLLDRARSLPTVWLVRAGIDLDVAQVDSGKLDVVVAESFGVRLTRRPELPAVGAAARGRRAAALRERAEAAGAVLDGLAETAHRLAALRRDLDTVAADRDALAAGDPGPQRLAVEQELRQLEDAMSAARSRGGEVRRQALARRGELDGLRRLLVEAMLLEPPDHGARVQELTARYEAVRRAQIELGEVAQARVVVAELLDVLRMPPPSESEVAATAQRIEDLERDLELSFRAEAALDGVLRHRQAASWSDAEVALRAQSALVPALEEQHRAARAATAAADQAVMAADAGWEQATQLAQEAEALRAAAAAHRERAAAELGSLGGAPAEDLVAAATLAVTEAGERSAELERQARGLVADFARTKERAEQAARASLEASTNLSEQQRLAGPAEAEWRAMRQAAERAGLVAAPVESVRSSDGKRTALSSVSSGELRAEASGRRVLLADRLSRCRGGEEQARLVRESGDPTSLSGAAAGSGADQVPPTIAAWLSTRDWLRRRVPAQIAADADPLLALERLRDHLDVLESRLARQEGDLRGASEDVARGIEVQLRRARGQVRRLNQHLEGIRFGSIAAIRVDMRRVDRMEQILRALAAGDAQELLFLPSMPIEEALDEIFRRYGGGRSGGQRLLDYREYLELVVEIRRQSGEGWEPASPTRLSTGEAIGVGAALMMVVLTEWERDANLLRARPMPGSLRFLFLDEANRLSRDNLGVLFELCRNLDLQLLIAAPEVARAEGNTTYRLVRHVADDGREEVLVSGRRAIAAEPGSEAEREPEPEGEAAAAAPDADGTSAPTASPEAAVPDPVSAPVPAIASEAFAMEDVGAAAAREAVAEIAPPPPAPPLPLYTPPSPLDPPPPVVLTRVFDDEDGDSADDPDPE